MAGRAQQSRKVFGGYATTCDLDSRPGLGSRSVIESSEVQEAAHAIGQRSCRRSLALCAAAIAASAFTSTHGLSASSRMSRAFSSASMACFIALSWPVRMSWSVTLLPIIFFCLFLIGFNVSFLKLGSIYHVIYGWAHQNSPS